MTYVGWAVIDMAYFSIQSQLTREQHMIFAKNYLVSSNLNSSDDSVRK